MSKNKKYSYKNLRALPILLFIILLIVIFGVGFSLQNRDTKELSEEEIVVAEEADDETIDEPREEIKTATDEILPLKREADLTGGTKVITPEGLMFEDIEFEVNDGQLTFIYKLEGIEWGRSYDISLSGETKSKQMINIYLLDGNRIDDITTFNISDVLVNNDESKEMLLAEVSLEAKGAFTMNELMTNGKKSTDQGVLYISVDDNDMELTEVSIKRHVGELKFNEDFDYEGLLDESKWDYEIGGNGWGNGELQYYTGKDLDNARVEDGNLIITAQEEKMQNNDYTSARVRTKDGFTYGRFEITAKLPSGRGTWPAIWMLSRGNNFGGWPNSGEIDIMEHVGYDMDVVHANLHMSEFNFRKNNNPTGMMTIPNVDTEYHTYTMEWTPYQIDMYIDGYHYMYFKNDGQGPKHWPYDESFYMLINIAIGGAWGGQQGIDPVFPQQLIIDSIKIYDLEDQVIDNESPAAIKSTDIVIQGTAVELSFDPVQDNYKVDHYEAVFDDGENQITHILSTTNGLILDLQQETTYELSIVAVDESGNVSEPYLAEVKTDRVSYGQINTWLTPEDIYFVNGASVIEEDDSLVIAGFESGHLLGYGFDIPSDGKYSLEIEISGKLFDGEVKVVDETGNELTTFIATKTGAKNSYNIIVTEAFELLGGKQVILLETIKNGYQIRNMRMVPST